MRPLAAVAAGLLAAAIAAGAWRGGVLDRTERPLVDARFSIRGDRATPRGVAVVAFDDATLRARFPGLVIPRRVYGPILDAVHGAGARAIAIDVQFDRVSDRRDDGALLRAIGRAGNVTLGTTVEDASGSGLFVSDAALRRLGARAGDAHFRLRQGVFRSTALRQQGFPTLAAVAVALAQAGRRAPAGGPFLIDWHGGEGTVPIVSVDEVLQGRGLERLRGRIVVVGFTANATQDVHPTPVGQLSGPEIQAEAIQTLLDGAPLREWPLVPGLLVILVLGLVPPLAGAAARGVRGPVLAGATALAGAALWALAAQLLFDAGHVVPLAAGWAAALLGGALAVTIGAVGEANQRRRTRELFERFVPAAVVGDVLAARRGGDLRLGGVRRDGTVLFCDLRGFTALAEGLEAEQVIEVLNRYLETMSDAILDHGGTLVTYLGDGIMAVWGAPLPQADHARRAFEAAGEMAGPRLAAFNTWLQAAGVAAVPLRMGIGLSSGPVMSGNVGSARRLEYTAVGDTTNVAARLQALSREHDATVLLTEATRAALSAGGAADPALRDVGEVAIRGRATPVRCWAVDVA